MTKIAFGGLVFMKERLGKKSCYLTWPRLFYLANLEHQPTQSTQAYHMKQKPTLLLTALATFNLSLLAAPDLTKLPPAAKKEGVTYDKDIKVIFESSCFRCHGDQRPKAGLRLNSLESVLQGSREGKVIVPGKGAESKLVLAVARVEERSAMPPGPRQGRGPGGSGGGTGAPAPQKDAGNGQNPNPPRQSGPPAKPLTTEQVALIRAWVDQGAK
jgi:mono/diheme cytochrome c family protein